ncbi:MAG: MBL fold metallo-hydrolase, partial [Chloroflexota bacterium]|nr:MBL fold metallo-hydrolase [Chloroflexota bacterium]
MAVQQVVPGLYLINLGFVNAYLLQGHQGLTLVDTGVPGSADKILEAVSDLGKQPGDVKQILITHLHGDHVGSLAALKQATGAPAYMHPADATLVRQGQISRPF